MSKKTAEQETGDIVVEERTAVTVAANPNMSVQVAAFDMSEDAGAGMEGADAASFAIPFLAVLQKLSPVCDETDGAYNPDAKPGMLMNTVTGQLYDGKVGVVILPVHYQRRFLRWGPRSSGGGFKGEMLPEVAAKLEFDGVVQNVEGRLYYPDADGQVNEKKCDRLADTRNHFFILEGTGQQMLLSLGSTQIKKSKALMSMLAALKIDHGGKKITPPTWAARVRVTTVLEQNDQGNWYGVRFAIEGLIIDQDEYEAGKAFNKGLKEGTAGEVRYTDPEEATGSDKF